MGSGNSPEVLVHVATNVRRIRQAAEMSQSDLAERAGVSRRTIIKLEAGEANVGLAGLDGIAAALGVAFTDLVAAGPASERHAVNQVAWRGADPASIGTLSGAVTASHSAELWSWSLGVSDRYDAQPDAAGWHEMIVVIHGRLRLELDDGVIELTVGEHAIYSTARQYAYVNTADTITRFARVVTS